MPYEGRKTSIFYSLTNYLSPLERKRLRAIENEPKATEVTVDRASNKRSTKETTSKISRQCSGFFGEFRATREESPQVFLPRTVRAGEHSRQQFDGSGHGRLVEQKVYAEV
ncbi:hypothetical protein MRX96_019159 [Rhipicephalus microplus]